MTDYLTLKMQCNDQLWSEYAGQLQIRWNDKMCILRSCHIDSRCAVFTATSVDCAQSISREGCSSVTQGPMYPGLQVGPQASILPGTGVNHVGYFPEYHVSNPKPLLYIPGVHPGKPPLYYHVVWSFYTWNDTVPYLECTYEAPGKHFSAL